MSLGSISMVFIGFSLIFIDFTKLFDGIGSRGESPEVVFELSAVVRCGTLWRAVVRSGTFWYVLAG